jgi:methyl-accepting chemotaxis protein
MLKNITIKSLLLFVMGLLSMLLVGTGVLGLTSLDTTNKALQSVYDDRTVPIGELNTVITSVMMNQIDLSGSIYGNPDLIIPKMDAIETRSKKADTAFAAYIATDLTPEEKIAADKFAAARKLYLEKALRPAVEASRGGNVLRVTEIVNGPMEELFTPVRTSVSDLIDIQLHEAKLLYDSSQHRFALVRNISIAAILFGVAVAAFMAFWLVRLIARPLHEAVRIAKSVAAGDLTQRIDVQSTNETGQLLQALKDMNDSLSRTVSTVRHGTETITVASSEIATGNADLSSRTESQAGSLEETASSMEELTSTVRQNADNARQANQFVLTASEVAIKGGERGQPGGRHDGFDQPVVEEDRRYHFRHRQHRVPDQHPRAECRSRSGTCRRTGSRLCRRRQRSAQSGATQRRRREGNQGTDRRLRQQGRTPAASWSTKPASRWKRLSAPSNAWPTS